MYGKLINGILYRAPKMLHIGSNNVWNPTVEQYAAAGYKPVEFTEMPEAPEGYYPSIAKWVENEGVIQCVWEFIKIPPDKLEILRSKIEKLRDEAKLQTTKAIYQNILDLFDEEA